MKIMPGFSKKFKKYALYVSITALAIVVPIILFQIFGKKDAAEAAWFNDSWAYRAAITFGNTGAAQSYQKVNFTVNTSAPINSNQMQSDCGDSRFTDSNGQLLRYYIASGCNTTTTQYWVLIPTISAGNNFVHHYYGNPSALNGTENGQFSQATFSPTSGPTVAAQETGQGPISYWSLDDVSSTNANDNTAQNNDLTVTNALWKTDEYCVSQNCLYFDGNADQATKAYSADTEFLAGTSSFTISTWFKHASAPGADILISRADAVNGVGWKLYMDSSGFICFGIDGIAGSFPQDSACTTTSYADSSWHYAAGVKATTSSITLYIDGLQMAQDIAISSSTMSGTNSPFTIGNDFDNGTNGWVGFIDEVKYYNFAKTAAQIKTDFASRGNPDDTAVQFGQAPGDFLTKGLMAYWELDDNTGSSAPDSSGNQKNGNIQGGASWTAGKFGPAVLFDDVNDSVSFGTNAIMHGGSAGTISAWVYPDTAVDPADIVYSEDSSGDLSTVLQLNISGTSHFAFNIDQSNGTWKVCEDPALAVTNTWTHVVGEYERGITNTIRLYINGALVCTNTTWDGTFRSTINKVYLGRNTGGGGAFWSGKIDEVRIYNRSLGSKEVESLYNWAPGPVGWWKMDDNTGTTSVDSSGNGNTGTFEGSPKWAKGKYGSGIAFDGAANSDDVDAGNADILDDLPALSISFWYYYTGGASNDRVVMKSTGASANGWWVTMLTGTPEWRLTVDYDGAQDLIRDTFSAGSLNTWNHLTITWDGSASASNVHMYLNGVEASSYATTQDGLGNRVLDTAQQFCFGGVCDQSRTFGGILDDLRIYNYARTPAQIIEDMNGGHPLGGSPVASQTMYWALDETSGTSAFNQNPTQSSLVGTLGTGDSSPTWLQDVSCVVNGCISMDAAQDYISAGDVGFTDALTQMTISFWINPLTLATNRSIVSKNNASQKSFAVVTDASNSDEIRVHIAGSVGEADNTTYFATSNLDLSASTWQHVLVLYDGTQSSPTSRVRVYKNGREVSGSYTGTVPTSMTTGPTSTLRVGNDDSTTYTALVDRIDELKIYSAALTNSEVLIDFNGSGMSLGGGVNTTHNNEGFGSTGPIGWWKMDENAGTEAYDSSGNGFTGTLTGGPVPDRSAAKLGRGLLYNGEQDASETNPQYVNVADNNTLDASPVTVSAWVKMKNFGSANSESAIISHHDHNDSQGYYLYFINVSGNPEFEFRVYNTTQGGRTAKANDITLTLNKWYFVTGVYDGTNVYVYVNGIRGGTTDTATSITANTDPLRIGMAAYANGFGMNGVIDDARVYNYALTQAQIAYAYNRGEPVAWYQFDECQGNIAYNNGLNLEDQVVSMNGTIAPVSLGNTAVGDCISSGSTMWYNGRNGKYNSSLDFDGSDDYVAVGGSPLALRITRDITVSAWVNAATISNGAYLYAHSTDGESQATNNLYSLRWDTTSGNDLLYEHENGAGSNTQNTFDLNLSTSTWYHIVMVRDATAKTIKVYINGLQQGGTYTYTNNPDGGDSGYLTIGSRNALDVPPAGTPFLDGQIDDVRIYNYAMISSQIQRLNNEGVAQRFGP